MTTKHIALAAALACITTSAQAQVIYLVPGGQYPVVGMAPGPYPIPGDPIISKLAELVEDDRCHAGPQPRRLSARGFRNRFQFSVHQ